MADDKPKVEPLDPIDQAPSEPRARRSDRLTGKLLVAALAGVIALAWFTSPEALPSPESTSTTSTISTSSTTTPDPPVAVRPRTPARALTLSEMIPEYRGELHVIEGGDPLELVTWRESAPAAPSLLTPGSRFELDVSGRLMAGLRSGGSAAEGENTLAVGAPGAFADVPGVGSYAWHARVPGRLAWVAGGEVCEVALDWEQSLPRATSRPACLPVDDWSLLGFDDHGYLMLDAEGDTVLRLDREGTTLASVPGSLVLAAPDGSLLIGEYHPSAGLTYRLHDALLRPIGDPLLLHDRVSLFSVEAAVAPHHPVRFAFLYPLARSARNRLEVIYPNLRRVAAFNLEGMVWGLRWDSTGRYLLVPGIVEETDHVLYVVDIATREVSTLSFEDWVQDAHLVVPAVCEERSAMAAGLVGDEAEGWLVRTRDPALGNWSFLTALLADGRLATWALPAHGPETPSQPIRVLAVDEVARELGGSEALDPMVYGRTHWEELDGSVISRHCPTG